MVKNLPASAGDTGPIPGPAAEPVLYRPGAATTEA